MGDRARWLGLVLALSLAAGCAAQPPRDTTPFAQMGGLDGVTGIVDDLLVKISDDARINAKFANANIVRLREKLIEQICVEAGGPCTYTGLGMHESHAGHDIREADFNALVEDLVAVMEARKVPVGAQNRLLKRLAAMHGEVVGP